MANRYLREQYWLAVECFNDGLAKFQENYAGRCIALNRSTVIHAGDTLDEVVKACLDSKKLAFVFYVPRVGERKQSPCLAIPKGPY